jgi:hypothetical protein
MGYMSLKGSNQKLNLSQQLLKQFKGTTPSQGKIYAESIPRKIASAQSTGKLMRIKDLAK